MITPSRRRGRWAAVAASVGLAAGLLGAATAASPAAAIPVTSAIPIQSLAGTGPQDGTLANGVDWSVDIGGNSNTQGDAYTVVPSDGPQTWTFSQPVDVRFSVTGLNCTGEAMILPAGTVLESAAADHTWDAGTTTITGNPASLVSQSFFTIAGVTSLVLEPVGGVANCSRGPNVMELTADVDPPAFDCDVATIFVGQGANTQLSRLEADDASFEPVGPPSGIGYNSIAYNEDDDLIYGASGADIIVIDANGAVTNLGQPTPGMGGTNAGVIEDGIYYTMSSGGGPLNRVDLATMINDPITLTGPGAGTADIAFINGRLWGDNGFVAGSLSRIDPDTGQVDVFASPVPASVAAGAAWTYGNGNLGLSDNNSGNLYQLAIGASNSPAPTIDLVSTRPGPVPGGNNDATSCQGLPADLSLSKTSTTPVLPGESVTWTITVTNQGPGTSTGYVVTDSIPDEFTGLSTSTPGCTLNGNDLTCLGDTLPAGESDVITVTGTAPATSALLPNAARVSGNEADPDPSDDVDLAETWVATTSGLCRGTAVSVLGIRLGSANNPERPCRTAQNTLVNVNQVIGAPLPWPLNVLNSTLRATAVSGSSVSGPRLAAAESHIAAVAVNIPSLALSLSVTGVHTAVSSTLGDSCTDGEVKGLSRIGTLVLNGQTVVIGDAPISIPLLGLGGLYINQRIVSGNTITQRAIFLDLPGTALDVIIAESKAGVVCDPAPIP